MGLSISYALDIAGNVFSLVVDFASTENYMTSVERVVTYSKLEPEPGYGYDTKVPDGWPSQGSVSFNNVCFRYCPGAPQILKGKVLRILRLAVL